METETDAKLQRDISLVETDREILRAIMIAANGVKKKVYKKRAGSWSPKKSRNR